MSKANAILVGASGYTGVEIIKILNKNSKIHLKQLFVSAGSEYANEPATSVYPELQHLTNLAFKAIDNLSLIDYINSNDIDLVFLATPHKVSYELTLQLIETDVKILDLSGAFRLSDPALYPDFYQFQHQHPELLSSAVYGLAEWFESSISQAKLIAVPGCYPTAALMALKPLVKNQLITGIPVINATSGVSGAGKQPNSKTHFCEVSLQPYGIFNHRHQPEIELYADHKVIFTPHLGQYKRGILMTITVPLKAGTTDNDLSQAYMTEYVHQPLIRLCEQPPAIDHVANTPFCDLYWKTDANNEHLIIVAAIDNLIKGAAGQAVQCANLMCGAEMTEGLL